MLKPQTKLFHGIHLFVVNAVSILHQITYFVNFFG